jgi:hypothetical protein
MDRQALWPGRMGIPNGNASGALVYSPTMLIVSEAASGAIRSTPVGLFHACQ